ncbi:hypothetical protein NE237_020047 [Protea cynaroides]|uniref:Uncharacterized protein n=1 Tax=Protea cynaroides TaxID=273540 RepID=A0A9Q0K288_9MAGN|nr:hypothetical protein NE237_020047 [Protea cynaroides]
METKVGALSVVAGTDEETKKTDSRRKGQFWGDQKHKSTHFVCLVVRIIRGRIERARERCRGRSSARGSGGSWSRPGPHWLEEEDPEIDWSEIDGFLTEPRGSRRSANGRLGARGTDHGQGRRGKGGKETPSARAVEMPTKQPVEAAEDCVQGAPPIVVAQRLKGLPLRIYYVQEPRANSGVFGACFNVA